MSDTRPAAGRFRRVPLVVDAVRVDEDSLAAVTALVDCRVEPARFPGPGRGITDGVMIRTLDEVHPARHGSWLLSCTDGRLLVVSDAEFRQDFTPELEG